MDDSRCNALETFILHPTTAYEDTIYRVKDTERYRLAMPLYASEQPSCMECHGSPENSRSVTAPSAAALSPELPAAMKLLGIVVVDIPSQVNQNQLFLNRAFILLAGLIAGTLATGVLVCHHHAPDSTAGARSSGDGGKGEPGGSQHSIGHQHGG